MADKFVWSGATGANDGSKWEDAYTSLMRDWGAEAGFTPATDFVYVRDSHAESTGAVLTITGSAAEGTTARVRVICVVGADTGTDPGNLSTTASVTTTSTNDINIDEGIYIYGVDFFSSDDIIVCLTVGSDHDIHLEACRLELAGGDAGDQIVVGTSTTSRTCKVVWTNVDVDFDNAGQVIKPQAVDFVWEGGGAGFDVNRFFLPVTASQTLIARIRGVDFSVGASSTLILSTVAASQWARFIFSRCLFATGMSIVGDNIDVPGLRVEAYHCQIGTDADPAYQMEINDSRGKIITDTSRYRTGGASDGERTNPISWDFDTTVGSVRGYPGHALESPPITIWSDGDGSTPHTYRIAIASDATINDDELWMTVEGPNDAATDSLAVFNTTRVLPRTAAAAHTTDSGSTWTGTGVGTKQYMQVTYTPDKPGPVTIRLHMAKASDNIYIDPKIQIDP